MSMSRKLQKKLFHKLLYSALALSVLSTGTAYAEEGMPQGGSVVTATAPTGFSANPVSGAAMTATANTLINWDSFNLGTGKTLTLDPNGFVFMHQVTGASQSEIQGILNGGTSGHLILANPHGIIIDGATINADHLTLTTMQNLDATGFSKLTSGGWGPEVNTNDQIVGITNSTIGVKHYLGVLAGVIMLADHVTVNTENSTIDLTAVKNGQYSLLMGRDAFYSNGVQYTNASNSIKIGDNTVLNVNGNSYNSIHILGGQVGIGDYAQLNTGSDPNMSNVLVEAVATKNDSESDSSKRYTASEDNVIHMGLVSFSNGNFALIGGKLAGETESFQEKFTKVGGETPTPPGPTPPGSTPPEPGSLTPEQKAQAHETANNLLDSAMNNDALKALQEAVSGSQTSSEGSNYVTIQSGGGSTGGLNIAKGLEGLTVSEAASRSRNLAKQYMQALQDGDKARADELKQQLKDANTTVKVLKEQEKLTKEETEKTKKATSTSQKPTTIEDYAKRFPGISELLNRPDWPQQPSEKQPQQSSGEAVVIGGSQESDALKRLNDIIGEKLLTQEADARARLRKAQTSEERQQIMKELDEIHRQETEKVNEALKKAKVTELEQKYNEPYGHYQYKVEYKLGDNQDDGSYRVNVPQDQKQREQYEAILRGQGNGDAQTGTSQPPYQGLNLEIAGPNLEKEQEKNAAADEATKALQGEQRTSVVETGGQSGLNIGGERPVVETETTRPRTGTSQQSTQSNIFAPEQKNAEQTAKDAAVKAAQEKLDQSRKEGFDKYAALQKAQHDLSAAEEKAEQAARDYLLALKSGDKYTIDAFKEELQKANDALLEAKRNEEAAQHGLKEAGSNIDRALTELNNAKNNFNDSSGAGGKNQQITQQSVQQQSGGETITTMGGESKESDSMKWINNVIGDKLLMQEADARARLRKAQTSEERQQIMKELDDIHAEETKIVNEALKQQGGGETITTMGGESTESDYMKGINNQLRDNLNHQEADARARLRIAVTPEAREKILKELDDIQDFRTRQGLGEYEPREPLNKDVYRDELVEKLNRQEAYGLERLRNERDMDPQTRENIIKALEEIRFERLKYGLDEGKDQFDKEYEAAKASGKDMNAWLDQYQTGNKDIKAILDRRQYNNEDVKALLDRAPKGNEGYQQSGGETVITTQEPQQTQLVQQQSGGETEAEHEAFMRGYRDAEEEWKAEQKREEAREKAEKAANDYLLALKSGDKSTIDAFKEELQKANDALLEAKRNEEAVQKRLNEAGLNIARAQTELSNAQNNVNDSGAAGGEYQQPVQQQSGGETEAEHEAFMRGYRDAEEEWKAEQKREEAREKAEKAANDYLLALKSGDKSTIDAFKEELQKANDALLEAKRNEEAVQKRLNEAGLNIARAQTELNNAQNNVNNSSTAGGESQQTQQTVGQPSQSQQTEKHSTVETGGQNGLNIGGSERPVVETETTRPRTGTSQQPAQEKTSALEQKVDDLRKQFWASVKDRDQASRDYRDAQERGASQEELDRLKARYDELEKQKDSNLAEYRAAKAEQKVDDLTKQYWEGVKDRDQAGRDYREAQERGASQEELDRLKARYDELEKQKDNNLAEYRASKAEMQSAREAADAAKAELKDAKAQQSAQQNG